MFYKKEGLPEEGELVMSKVTSIHFSSVFVELTDYGKLSGHIHISEISPGRIRNIRDFVKEGKVITCKVLRVNQERQQVDLSLRRVTEMQRRLKVNQMKQEQKAETILSFVADKLKEDAKKLYDEVSPFIFEKYEFLFSCFEDHLDNKNLFKELGLPQRILKPLIEVVEQRIKPPEVNIGGKLKLSSSEPNGVELIKDALVKAEALDENISIFYLGAGAFSLYVKSSNYKDAEKILEGAINFVTSEMVKNEGIVSFHREKVKN